MPRVPIPNVQQQPVRLGEFSAPRTVPQDSATGEQLQQLGQATAYLGAGIQRYGIAVQSEFDDAKVMQAQNRLAESIRQHMTAPGTGYLNTVGEAATGDARKQTFEGINRDADRIAEGLTSEEQRKAFGVARDQRLFDASLDADAHETKQQRVFKAGQLEAQRATLTAEAASLQGTPRGDAKKASMLVTVDETAALHGWSAEETAQAKLDATTNLHTIVLQDMVATGNATAAKSYLDANQGEMQPKARAHFQEAVKRVGINEQSEKLTQDIVGEVGDAENPEAAALAIAQATYNGKKIPVEVLDETRQRIQQHYDLERKATATENVALTQRAQRWLVENKSQPIEAFPEFEAVKSRGLLPTVSNFARNGRIVTDPRAFYNMMERTPGQWRAMSVDQVTERYGGVLDEQDMRLAYAKHADASGRIKEEGRNVLTQENILDNAERELGIDDDPAQGYVFRTKVRDAVRLIESKTGKKATEEEFERAIGSIVKDRANVSGFLFNDLRRRTYGVSPDDAGDLFLFVRDGRVQQSRAFGAEEVSLSSIPLDFYNEALSDFLTMDEQALQRRQLPNVQSEAIMDLWLQAGRPDAKRWAEMKAGR